MATTATDDPEERRKKIALIAEDDALRQEAARLLPEFERLLERPSNDQLYAALQPLLLIKRMPDFGNGEAGKRLKQAWLSIYYDQLRPFPIAAIRLGVREVVRSHKYPDMPQPAELITATQPFSYEVRTAHYRMKSALALEVKRISKADREANRKAMEEAGWLDADGEFDIRRCMAGNPNKTPPITRPKESPQQMADRIRREAK